MKEHFSRIKFMYEGSAAGFRCDEIILPNNKKAQREYLTHPGAVAVVPLLDSPGKLALEKCRVVMVEQFRYPVRETTEEIPAGKLDGKEPLASCLARELKEETGYSSSRFRKLISYWPTPAFSNEMIHIYWADTLKKGRSSPDDDEFLKVKIETVGTVLRKIRQGKIRDSKTVIAFLALSTLKS